MPSYPLWSSDWEVVEHGVLLLWRDVWDHLQGPNEDLSSLARFTANSKMWTTLSSLLGCAHPRVELAVVHCLSGLFSRQPQLSQLKSHIQLQESLVATHCIENLCVKLISPYDMANPTARETQELVALTMINICKASHHVDRVCAAGAMDAFTFLVLQDEPLRLKVESSDIIDHVHRMQEASLQCITLCVEHSMACLEDFDHTDILVHVLAHYVLDHQRNSPRRVQVGMTLLASCMNHQPLICRLLIHHGLLQALTSMLQASVHLQMLALEALKYLLTCKSKHDNNISRETVAHLRMSGGLIYLAWLACAHANSNVERAATNVFAAIVQWANASDEGGVLAQDLVEQGCLLLLVQRQDSPTWLWLLAQLSGEDSSNHLVSAAVRSTNDLLRTNVIVGLCVMTKLTMASSDEWWPSVQSVLMDSSNTAIWCHVLRVLIELCCPVTIKSTCYDDRPNVVPRLPLPFLHGSLLTLTWPSQTKSVSKSAMMQNSAAVATMLYADATCATIPMPHAIPSHCMDYFLQMCQRTTASPVSRVEAMDCADLLDLASVAQKMGMLALLSSVEDALKVQYFPHQVARVLRDAVSMRIPSVVLICLHAMQSLPSPTTADDDDATALAIGMLLG
ncbi:hypothetical protein H257_07815 [Aphanomyces astaci]|uniref:Uncharacterized protein n=1 Tax=Aphanomyces astaci TaxID=112090 RepID=W4GH95_APHAT|nr:hypothetical protein H257_07815 [Aphanomyces astaci]ETV79050.1 hypothetical protein H257_07815 [Aphanomyces astaci]|eukprot:XP_009831769.1 hypothetical protein H257_07815 [Aphanomyces astaci]